MTASRDEGIAVAAPRVFISYAHEPPSHRDEVRKLWELLRRNGVDAKLDLSATEQRRDWTVWMADQLRAADAVLCLASDAYRRRAESTTVADDGRGVQWEAQLIREHYYRTRNVSRFLPVVLPGETVEGIPDFLSPTAATAYFIRDFTVNGAEQLLRTLLDDPAYPEAPLGPRVVFGPVPTLLDEIYVPPPTDLPEPMFGDGTRNAREIAQLIRDHTEFHADRRGALGPYHQEMMSARHQLAYWTGQRGDYARARDICADVFATRTRVLGGDHPATLRSSHDMTMWSFLADTEKAILTDLETLLDQHIKVLGLGHRQTLRVWTSVCDVLGTISPARALDQLTDLVDEHTRLLGPVHVDTLRVRYLHGWRLTRVRGQEGLDVMVALLSEYVEHLGPRAPRTLLLKCEIARSTEFVGDHDTAMTMYQGLRPTLESVLDRNHVGALELRSTIAELTGKMGAPKKARGLLITLYREQVAILGAGHIDTLRSLRRIARWSEAFDEPGTVLDSYRALVHQMSTHRGE